MPRGPEAAPSKVALVELEPGHWRLEGDLDLAGVGLLAREGSRLAAGGADVTLDLGGISQGSSAAVALLLEWHDQVRAGGGHLRLRGWSDALIRIATLSNVDDLLDIELPGTTERTTRAAGAASSARRA
ncbi:MAG: STAS domain-containing protein [Thiohalocapsa sp.]|jgi:anti-anti-sigma factor|nr:STAS domain-containing protein [Thiohalocapsa sp.]MCF7990289.1 STAS domain-containing protein [Thiohalocapsa sp.]